MSSRGDLQTKLTTAINHDASNYHTELSSHSNQHNFKRKKLSIKSVVEEIVDINTRAYYDFDTTKQSIININRKLERQTNRVREGNKLITHLVLSLPALDEIV